MRTIGLSLLVLLLVVPACKRRDDARAAPPDGPAATPETPAPPETPPPAPAVSMAQVAPPGPKHRDRSVPTTTPGAESTAHTAARVAAVARMTVELLTTRHLRKQALDDTVSRKAFERYLEALDGSKLYLLASHVAQLRAHEVRMDDELREGTLLLADEGGTIRMARIRVVRALVAALLAAPMNYEDDEEWETDADKRTWCRTEDELRERWRQFLERQLLYRVAKGDGPIDPKLEASEREALAKRYETRFVRALQEDRMDRLERFVNAVAHVYDPHTSYMAPARQENFDIRMSHSLEGIGAVLSVEGEFTKVVRIVPGSASWRQGELEAEDIILAVQNPGDPRPTDVVNMRLQDVVHLIRGKKNTEVRLTVRKHGEDRTIVIPIVRDVVNLDTAAARGAVLEHPKRPGKVGYAYLPSFYGNTRRGKGATPGRSCVQDMRALLERMNQAGVRRLILDLRGNTGGLLAASRKLAGLFIDTGPIVQTRRWDGQKRTLKDPDSGVLFDGDLVVLVNRSSASASEIVAAALQDYGRAVLVGPSPTHGKGTVQVLLSLDRMATEAEKALGGLGVLKTTQMQFYRVTGPSTQHQGVTADVRLPDPAAHREIGERTLTFSLPPSAIDPVPFTRWPGGTWDLAALARRSAARVAADPDYQRLIRRTAILKAREQNTRVPLGLKAWRAQRDARRAALEAVAPPPFEPKRLTAVELPYRPKTPTAPRGAAGRRGEKPAEPLVGPPEDEREPWVIDLESDADVEEALQVLVDMHR